MAARKGGLGKGLDTLIPPKKNETTKEVEKVEIKKIEEYVDINKVEPNKDQPRKSFNEDSLIELSESIKQHKALHKIRPAHGKKAAEKRVDQNDKIGRAHV